MDLFCFDVFAKPVYEWKSTLAFVESEDYRKWAKDKPNQVNCFAYLDMVKEREHANRLEF